VTQRYNHTNSSMEEGMKKNRTPKSSSWLSLPKSIVKPRIQWVPMNGYSKKGPQVESKIHKKKAYIVP